VNRIDRRKGKTEKVRKKGREKGETLKMWKRGIEKEKKN
jgi:hypothetical protein